MAKLEQPLQVVDGTIKGLSLKQAVDLASYLKETYGIAPAKGGAVVVTITDHTAHAASVSDPIIARDIDRLAGYVDTLVESGEAGLAASFQRTLITLASAADDDDLDRPI